MLGLFNYRKFLFERLKVLIARIFQVVKSFRFTNVGSVRNFISRNSARVQNCKLLLVVEMYLRCFPSSKCEPRSFAKCLQNLLIKKSVERL